MLIVDYTYFRGDTTRVREKIIYAPYKAYQMQENYSYDWLCKSLILCKIFRILLIPTILLFWWVEMEGVEPSSENDPAE